MVLCCGCCAGAESCLGGTGFEEETEGVCCDGLDAAGACCFDGFEDAAGVEVDFFVVVLPLSFFEVFSEEAFDVSELEVEAVSFEAAEGREDVSWDVLEEDSFDDDIDAERELEEASKAFSFPFVPPKIPTIKSRTKKPPKILPAILNVPAFVGCFCFDCFVFIQITPFFYKIRQTNV